MGDKKPVTAWDVIDSAEELLEMLGKGSECFFGQWSQGCAKLQDRINRYRQNAWDPEEGQVSAPEGQQKPLRLVQLTTSNDQMFGLDSDGNV